MKLFYTPDISNSKTYTLSESESKHAVKVLRLSIDDMITLIDGKGCFYQAKITDSSPKKCVVEITSKEEQPYSKPKLHLAIAPTKNNDRLEWLIEKATELGIYEITPLLCEHSERKVLKTERLVKRAVAAMKQSLKAHLPIINDIKEFKTFVSTETKGERFIAHCIKDGKQHIKDAYKSGLDCTILIGPEGDFSENEINVALKNNYKAISLGESRLRTETAGLYACSTFNLLND
jgi:16S rRNA (uracil1498-N3)-methyltransferase